MLDWKVITKTLSSFSAITFVLCVVFGLIVPGQFHASWLLETMLPGFKWLSVGSVLLGLTEAAIYGAWAGVLFSALYNFFARRAATEVADRLTAVRAA